MPPTYPETRRERRATVNSFRDELVSWLDAHANPQPDAFGDGEYERGYAQAIKDMRERVDVLGPAVQP